MSNVNLDSLPGPLSNFLTPSPSENEGTQFRELAGNTLQFADEGATPARQLGDSFPHPIPIPNRGEDDGGFGVPGRAAEDGFTIYDVPVPLRPEMAAVFRLYSGDVPGEGDGALSREDMKAAIDDGVVSFGFSEGDGGFGLQVDLDSIPWEKISTFLTTFTGGVDGEDIHAGTFVDAVEWLMGGKALGVEFDDLDVQMLTELHNELTEFDTLDGASATELALLLQSDDFSLESLLPPKPLRPIEADRIRFDGKPLEHVKDLNLDPNFVGPGRETRTADATPLGPTLLSAGDAIRAEALSEIGESGIFTDYAGPLVDASNRLANVDLEYVAANAIRPTQLDDDYPSFEVMADPE